MTLAEATTLAETAYLGAILAVPTAIPRTDYLHVDDLTDPTARIVVTAARQSHADHPDAHSQELLADIAHRLRGQGISIDQLRSYVELCPNPDAAATYGQILLESSFRRSMTTYGVTLARQAADGGPEPAEQARTQALAAALQRLGDQPTPPTPAPEPPADATDPPPRPEQPQHAEPAVRAALEDQVLSDLLRNPDQIPELRPWLPAETFTAPHRQQLYTAILTAAAATERLVDPVTVTWQLERLRLPNETYRVLDPHTGHNADVADVLRLAALPTQHGDAIRTAHRILIDDHRALAGNVRREPIGTGTTSRLSPGNETGQSPTHRSAPALPPPTPQIDHSPHPQP